MYRSRKYVPAGGLSMVRWSRWCAWFLLVSLPFAFATPASPAPPERSVGTDQPCLVLAQADPLDLVRVAQATPAQQGQVEQATRQPAPITKEEVGFLIHDLQRIPL